jgi:hypothetical protein
MRRNIVTQRLILLVHNRIDSLGKEHYTLLSYETPVLPIIYDKYDHFIAETQNINIDTKTWK